MAGPRLSALGVRRASAAACLLLSSLSGCGGDVVNLGSSGPPLIGGDAGSGGSAGSGGAMSQGGTEAKPGWLNATLIVSTAPDERVSYANGTLTREAERLYFTRQIRGEPKTVIQFVESSGVAWSQPSNLEFGGELVEDASSPAISLAGNQLWFGSRRDGVASTDIWASTGVGASWSVPKKVDELSSLADDAPRQPAVQGTIMPLSSKRHGGQQHQIYLATRDAEDQPWQEPSQALLGSINSPDYESVDGFLTENGLTLLFSSTRDGTADLFRARRASLGEPFGEPERLEGPNSPFDERDPWLRESDQRLFFSSNRSGLYEIYQAAHTP